MIPVETTHMNVNLMIHAFPTGLLLCSAIVAWCTYPCNAYGNVKWNETDKSEVRPEYLPKFRDPYNVKCTENCDRYRRKMELLLKGTVEDKLSLSLKSAFPNPFCFDWDDEYDKGDNTLNYKKLKSRCRRSADGSWRNTVSISFSIATIMLLSAQTSLNEDSPVMDIWLPACVLSTILSHLGTLYYSITAFSYLRCQQRFAAHTLAGKFKEFKFQQFCDSTRMFNYEFTKLEENLLAQLPGIPLEWTLYKWNLVLNYLVTIALVAAAIYNIWRRRANVTKLKEQDHHPTEILQCKQKQTSQ